jgi:hypothetical protein
LVCTSAPPFKKVETPFIDTKTPKALDEDDHEVHRGALAPIASKVLMKILYCARVGRYDLLRAVCWLATKVTKWSKTCDAALHRLVCYINSTLDVYCWGWIGDKWEDLELTIYSDADWAGDKTSYFSTTGGFMCLTGRNTFFPLAAMSKKQSCVSHSTPEAEIVAADMVMKSIGIPALQLWDTILGKPGTRLKAKFREDNEAAIKIFKSGKNPTMRHMQRTHGICLSWLCEQFNKGEFDLSYCPTAEMSADIFTKAFIDALKWMHARKLISHFSMSELGIGVTQVNGNVTSITDTLQGG